MSKLKKEQWNRSDEQQQQENYRAMEAEREVPHARCMMPGCGNAGVPLFNGSDGNARCGLCTDRIDMHASAREARRRQG